MVAHGNDVLIHRLQAKVDKLQDELTTTKVTLAVANARIGTKEKRDRNQGTARNSICHIWLSYLFWQRQLS